MAAIVRETDPVTGEFKRYVVVSDEVLQGRSAEEEHKEEHKMDANEVADAVENRNEIFRLKSALFGAEVRIQGLMGDLEGTARNLVEKEDLIERITVRLHELAEEQGWCGQFDQEMEKYGLRPRLQKHTVRARMIRTKNGEQHQEFYIEDYIATGTSETEATATMADHPGVKDLVAAGWELVLAWIYEDNTRDNDEDYY